MTRRGLLLCSLAASLSAAGTALAEPGLSPPPGARLPLDLVLSDENGHRTTLGTAMGGLPAIFAFADYGCQVLCGSALGMAAALLPETGLRPGTDYRLVVLGLDPADGPRTAGAMRRAWLGEAGALTASARFLVGDATAIAAAEAAMGYTAERRDVGFDHPLALLAVAADGRLAAVLPGLGASPEAIGVALRRAADQRSPGFVAQVVLLCRAAAHGGRVLQVLSLAGAATLALMGAGLFALWRRGSRT